MTLRFILLATCAFASAAQAGDIHVSVSDAAGFSTNSVWYDDGQEVTVVDAQFTPQAAAAVLADIHAQTKSPVTRVIVTHPNADKFNGLSAFAAEGATIIASSATAEAMPVVDAYKRYYFINIAKAFTEDTYPTLTAVSETFTDTDVITLKSGETITLLELAQPGVASTQTVVRIDASGDLIVGDLVAGKTHAWLEGGLVDGAPVPTLDGWKADLAELATLGKGNVYGGRGDAQPVVDAVAQQTAYLDTADKIVTDYIAGLGDKVGELSDPALQGAHYAAIQAEFVTAFPDYALPDLIGYSVYGLVGQKLATAN
jgi:glyoxylase-like metal-dependent hydrolase (beta-lactamase superfamily II)